MSEQSSDAAIRRRAKLQMADEDLLQRGGHDHVNRHVIGILYLP